MVGVHPSETCPVCFSTAPAEQAEFSASEQLLKAQLDSQAAEIARLLERPEAQQRPAAEARQDEARPPAEDRKSRGALQR